MVKIFVIGWLEDHVEALYLILKKGQPGESYNIGGNSEFQNIEVARLICHILDEGVQQT